MNKTVTINISGIIFNIDEQAYQKLQRYLETIRGYFSSSEGRDEIMADIESRIAELFQEKINEGKQVIGMADVDQVIEAMGQPEQFATDLDDEDEPAPSSRKTTGQRTKNLYRDPDQNVLGGVCAGLGHYFGTDPVWWRAAFLVAFFFFGTGVIFYLILWGIVPEAKSTSEKLEMRGEHVNIDNIAKSVEEEMSKFADRMAEFGNKAADKMGSESTKRGVERAGSLFVTLLQRLLESIGKLIGVALIIGGVTLLILILVGILGPGSTIVSINPDGFDTFNFQQFSSVFFSSGDQETFAITAILILIGVPLLSLVVTGIRLMLGFKRGFRGLGLGFTILWLAGIGVLITVALDVREEFNFEGIQIDKTALAALPSDSVAADSLGGIETLEIRVDNDVFATRKHSHHGHPEDFRAKLEDERLFLGGVTLDVQRSETDSFYVEVLRVGYGESKKDARARAREIKYNYTIDGDVATFDPYFEIDPNNQWRGQQIELTMYVPTGKSIHFGRNTEALLHGVDNVRDTWDHDMVGLTWTMTEKGLDCPGCTIEGTEIPKRDEDPDVYIERDRKNETTTIIVQ